MEKGEEVYPENQTSEMLSNKSLIRVNPMLGISFELAERLSSPSGSWIHSVVFRNAVWKIWKIRPE